MAMLDLLGRGRLDVGVSARGARPAINWLAVLVVALDVVVGMLDLLGRRHLDVNVSACGARSAV
eukprot:1129471-Amphidinium_carterae.1